MIPVLFSINKVHVSSFGVFLALGFLVGVFLIWRLSRAWDLDEERILDLTLLTFLGGLVGARVYFVLENLSAFSDNFLKVIFINKQPGLSFWGAFLGGWLAMYFFTKAKKMNFLQIGDIASVGLLGGLILADLGCFLGSCNIGIKSNLFLAFNMVGFAGKRFPVQLLEGLLLFWVLSNIWSLATHFHQQGKILGLSLIYIGLIKFLMEFLKQTMDEGLILSVVLFFLGVTIFYKVTKRKLVFDIKSFFLFIPNLLTDSVKRKQTLVSFKKYWYNQTTLISWKVRNFKKTKGWFNAKFSYKNNK